MSEKGLCLEGVVCGGGGVCPKGFVLGFFCLRGFCPEGVLTTRCPPIAMEISEGKSFHCFDVKKMTASNFSVFNLSWYFPYQSVTSGKHCSIFVIASVLGWLCFTPIYVWIVSITVVSCNDVTDGSRVYAV